jgi:hypothetical protein
MPIGECPECGFLVYTPEANEKWNRSQAMLAVHDELVSALEKSLAWLDGIVTHARGNRQFQKLMDLCPNDFGRPVIRDLLAKVKGATP